MKKVVLAKWFFLLTVMAVLVSAPITSQASEKVNINTASVEELAELPGIGETIAQRVIDYRTDQSFQKTEDIQNVKGIGEAKYEKIKDMIRTE